MGSMLRTVHRLLRSSRPLRRAVHRTSRGRAAEVVGDVAGAILPSDTVIDIGAGTCTVTEALKARGIEVLPVDIMDFSCVDGLRPLLCDGRSLPFQAGSFEVALLVTVLHHVRDPERVLAEAGRVARRVVVQEDIYEGQIQRYLTYAMDAVTNLELFGHPHSNRDDTGWRETFARMGFRLDATRRKHFWGVFSSATYELTSPPFPK